MTDRADPCAGRQNAAVYRFASRPACTAPLFGLAPDGVYRARPVTRPAGELLPHRFTLTAAKVQAPWPRRFIFCGTFPIRAAMATGRWALPTIAPFGVRTFLRGMSLDSSLGVGLPALSTNQTPRRSSRRHGPLYTLYVAAASRTTQSAGAGLVITPSSLTLVKRDRRIECRARRE